MLIIETPLFTKRVLEALTDDEYRELQHFIAEHPEAGSIIPGSHGLRKLRWTISGKGKRGGTRGHLLLAKTKGHRFGALYVQEE
jgi:hypothetical protein